MSAADVHALGTSGDLTRFLLVFARCFAMFSIMPIFSTKQIPVQVRLGLCIVIAYVINGTLPAVAALDGTLGFALAITTQVMIGLVFGFVASFISAGVQAAGELVDTQVGFAITNIVNPLTGVPVSLLGQFEVMLATLLFLTTDAHLTLLQGVAGSFAIVPLPFAHLSPDLAGHVTLLFSHALWIIFKIAAPIAVSLFVTNIALGLLTRVAPQINVFIVGLPAQLGLGLLMVLVSLPIFGYAVPQMFHELPMQLDSTLRLMNAPNR